MLCGLAQWGNEHRLAAAARQEVSHHQCGIPLNDAGMCPHCTVTPAARDVDMQQPRRADAEAPRISEPRRLLEPVRL